MNTQPMCQNRILMVDDDLSIRSLGTSALFRAGYGVDAAADGAAAWKALNASLFDLLITDNDMPELTGIELLARMAAIRMGTHVIMISGNPPMAEFTRRPWLKPIATLLKPFSTAELLGIVRSILGVDAQPVPDRQQLGVPYRHVGPRLF